MMEADSDSGDHFNRAYEKIKEAYPDFRTPKDELRHHRKKYSDSEELDSQSEEDDESDEESESESESESEEILVPKKKKIKKEVKKEVKRERKREENMQEIRAARHRAKEVKVEDKNPREALVGEVAVRWWYCLPEWPPVDYDYDGALKSKGYRMVQASKFKLQENVVGGLTKVTPVDGYTGMYKSKSVKIVLFRL